MSHSQDAELTVKWGCSRAKKSPNAVREALAMFGAGHHTASLVLVYGSIRYDYGHILTELRRELGDVPVVGCTTSGEMSNRGVQTDGLVIAALTSPSMDVGVGYGRNVFRDPRAAARHAVAMALRQQKPAGGNAPRAYKLCIVHTAGFTLTTPGVEEEVMDALREQLGAEWLIAGGSAGDGLRFLGSRQLAGSAVLEDSVVVALVASDVRICHDMQHGFVPATPERSFAVSEARGAVVRRIDGEIAADCYARLVGTTPEQLTLGLSLIRMSDKVPKILSSMSQRLGLTPQMISEKVPFFRYAVEHPFGVETSHGRYVARVPKVITPEGFLEFQARMDNVEKLYAMKLDRERTLHATSHAIAQLQGGDGGATPKVVLIYECAGRYMILRDQVDALFTHIRHACHRDAVVVGFFSSAEQGRMQGLDCRSHNYTASVVGFG